MAPEYKWVVERIFFIRGEIVDETNAFDSHHIIAFNRMD